MAGNRAASAGASAIPQRRTAASAQPRLSGRNHFRAAQRHALADASHRAGIRQRQHLLEAFPRLDEARGLAPGAPAPFTGAGTAGKDRPGTCGDRQRLNAGAKRGAHTGPNPTDRGKKGCKRHVVTDATGLPLVVRTGPANQVDKALALAMLESIRPYGGERGRPRRRPKSFQGGRGVRNARDHRRGCPTARAICLGALWQHPERASQRIGHDALRRGAHTQLAGQLPSVEALLREIRRAFSSLTRTGC